jgi:hypothetical protein
VIKDMTDEGLVAHYWATRTLLANAAEGRMARRFARLERELDICVAVARRRGVRLV